MVLPSIRDPRLHVATIIISIHVLGQTVLGFHVTVPQILAAILTCAVIEIADHLPPQRHSLVWPASAMLTGSGVALIMRAVGTPAGDPWGVMDIGLFAGVAAFGLATKYLIKVGGTHIFNPSNIALVVAFLVLGSDRVQPLDFWWGPFDAWLFLAYGLILVGGILITRRLHLLEHGDRVLGDARHRSGHPGGVRPLHDRRLGVRAGLWHGLLAGHRDLARGAHLPVLHDHRSPRPSPRGRVARIVFAVSVGALACLLIAPQTNEWWTKVMLLSSLVVVCAARPLIERLLPRPGHRRGPAGAIPRRRRRRARSSPVRPATGRPDASASRCCCSRSWERASWSRVLPHASRNPPSGRCSSAIPSPSTRRRMPPVTIDPDVRAWNVDRVRADAQGLALTLARHLRAEDQVMLDGDPTLLTAARPRRPARRDDRPARRPLRPVVDRVTTDYDFDSLFLTQKLLHRQSGLGMAFEATGTQTQSTYDSGGTLLDRHEAPYALTFVMREVFGDDRWFLVGVLPTD